MVDGPPLTLTLGGEFDISDTGRLKACFDGVVDAAVIGQRVRLDLGKVTFCSSSVLSCLLHLQRDLETRGIPLDLVAISPVMRRLLEVTGTSLLFGAMPPEP